VGSPSIGFRSSPTWLSPFPSFPWRDGTRLQAEEQFVQSRGNAEVLNESTELREATVAGQTWVRLSKVNLAWVGTMNTASAPIPISALASKRISSHLLGAWRGLKRLHRNEYRCSR